MSDGAAAVLMARRSTARRLGLPILATLKSSAVAGVPPAIMGIGPAVAIPKALEKAGLSIADIDIFEINEVVLRMRVKNELIRTVAFDREFAVCNRDQTIAVFHCVGGPVSRCSRSRSHTRTSSLMHA